MRSYLEFKRILIGSRRKSVRRARGAMLQYSWGREDRGDFVQYLRCQLDITGYLDGRTHFVDLELGSPFVGVFRMPRSRTGQAGTTLTF